MILMLLLICSQDLDLAHGKAWATLARPWMTADESALYDRLSPAEQTLFQGYFVARRSPDARQWSETGKFLPAFFCPQTDGDVRDQIRYLLGEPTAVAGQASNPELPARWTYPDFEFPFVLRADNHVELASAGRAAWERAKQRLIMHEDLRYDFSIKSFGRTRLPEDIHFEKVAVASHFQRPQGEGAWLHVQVAIPEQFRDYLRKSKANPIQQMELLVQLERAGDVVREGEAQVRHGAQRLDLFREHYLNFEVFLPQGYFEAELKIYSGYLKEGLSASLPIAIRSAEIPRLSDPILCQDWGNASIERFGSPLLYVGNASYRPIATYQSTKPARVLVQSPYADTRVLRQDQSGTSPLKTLEHSGDWWVFELPPRTQPFRLLALGYPSEGKLVALGQTGSWQPEAAKTLAGFKEDGSPNYLALEDLHFTAPAELGLMFVNDQAYLGSRDGIFDWRPYDWGKIARISYETEGTEGWQRSTYRMRRSAVYEQVSVKPKYLVAGTRALDGAVVASDFRVTVVDQPVKISKKTPFKQVPKLWGIVVNDPLLKSTSWTMIRDSLKRWLRLNTGPDDMIYVVHSSDRPQMLMAPTNQKILVQSALDALEPRTENENYFTVQYLIDALTQMSEHQTRAHQVLLLTDGLTDEVRQMEDLIPKLRATGLHLYNLEFPFVHEAEPPAPVNKETDALETMAIREANYRALRGNLQEDLGSVPVASIQFTRGKSKRQGAQDRIRDQAFREAFNRQLAGLTAGLTASAEIDQSAAGLERFFDKLSAWQANLTHLELSVPYLDADLVKVLAPEGYTVSWTIVEWHPESKAP